MGGGYGDPIDGRRQGGTVRIWYGDFPCEIWTAVRRDHTSLAHEQWVLGFLTGVGYMGFADGIDPLKGTDANAVWGSIDTYCRANPRIRIADAAVAYFQAHLR